MPEAGCGGAGAKLQAFARVPALVQPVEHPCAERVPGANRSGYVALGQIQGAARQAPPVPEPDARALGHVHAHHLHVPELMQGVNRALQSPDVKAAAGFSDLYARGPAGLYLVQNKVVGMAQRRGHYPAKPVALLADHVHARLDPGGANAFQQPRRDRAEFPVRPVHPVQQEQIAEMKDAAFQPDHGHMFRPEQGICPAAVVECPLAGAGVGHDIGIGSSGLVRSLHGPGINPQVPANLPDIIPGNILSDHSDAHEGEPGAQAGKVSQDVER